MNVNKEEFERHEKNTKRSMAERELDIKRLVDVIDGFMRLLSSEWNEEIPWALEGISDSSLDSIACMVAKGEEAITEMNEKYLF